MTLPTSRNTTYGSTSPVLSADLNDLQDCIIGGKHGSIIRKITAAAAQPATAVGTWSFDGLGWIPSALGSIWIPLPVFGGEKITQVRVPVACGSGDQFFLEVRRLDSAAQTNAAVTPLAGSTQTSSGSTGATETLTVNVAELVNGADDHTYAALVTALARVTSTLKVFDCLLTVEGQ